MGDQRFESPPVLSEMSIPTANSLYCFTATINPGEEKDRSATSDYHWQILKCRMLLFTAPVLACPVTPLYGGYAAMRDLTVICRREDIVESLSAVDDDGDGLREAILTRAPPPQLQVKLSELQLSASKLRSVSDAEYSACLEYTLRARLGPLWNPLEDKLIQGRDFLTCGQLRDAARMEINVHGSSGTAWIGLRLCRLRIAPLDMAAMDLSAPALEQFLTDPLGHINEHCIGRPWVHVLPSLKKGMVMGISKTMTAECPFPRYKDLRRHWKNMYGYRLPDQPAGLSYASVYFMARGGDLMCYPWLCLTPQRPTVLRCRDTQAAAVAFLSDVATRMPTVCGTPCPVTINGLVHPVVGLQEAREPTRSGGHNRPNLRPAVLAENSSSPSPPRDDDDDDTPATCPLSLSTQKNGSRPNVEWNMLKTAPSERENKENIPPNADSGYDSSPQRLPLRPVFRARAPAAAPSRIPLNMWFRPSCTSSPKEVLSSTVGSVTPHGTSSDTPSGVSVALSEPGPSSATALPDATTSPVFRIPTNRPIFLSRLPAMMSKAKMSSTISKVSVSPSASRPQLGRVPSPHAGGLALSAAGMSRPRQPAGLSPNASPRARMTHGASPTSARKATGSSKRPSTEAPLVPELKSADDARRASVPLLLAWLRDKGVPCRTKDKKAELVEKVVAKLGERVGQ